MPQILYESQEPIDRIKKFIHSIIISKIFNLVSIIALVLVIPLTVFFAQQQQELRQRASGLPTTPPTSTPLKEHVNAQLSIKPHNSSMDIGETQTFDIILNPGKHTISFVKILIAYTNSHLATSSANITNSQGRVCTSPVCINQKAFPALLSGPTYTPGFISFDVGVGADPTKAIRKRTTVATLTFKALPIFGIDKATMEFVTTNNQTQLLSISPKDSPNQNVLKSAEEATVKIKVPKKNKQNTTLSPTPSN